MWTPGVGDVQGGLACCGSWGCKKSDTAEWLNWTEYFSVYVYHSSLILSSADGHLGCLHVWLLYSAAMNTGVHVSLSILLFLLCILSSGIAGSYGSSISIFLKESPLFSIVKWTWTLFDCLNHKYLPNPRLWIFSPTFSSRCFVILDCMLMVLVINFCVWCDATQDSFVSHMGNQFF